MQGQPVSVLNASRAEWVELADAICTICTQSHISVLRSLVCSPQKLKRLISEAVGMAFYASRKPDLVPVSYREALTDQVGARRSR